MVGMAFAAVPLYRVFCQATGFYGTGRRAIVRADHRVQPAWSPSPSTPMCAAWPGGSSPVQASQTMHLGENKLAFFRVTNTGDKPVTGRAIYNVTPAAAGPYFSKLECFCFKNQTLAPGETVEFPVVYFVDPRYGTNADTRGTPEITLSYTFFPAVTGPRVSSNQGSAASHRRLASWRIAAGGAIAPSRSTAGFERRGTRHGSRGRQARLPPGEPQPVAAGRLDRGVGSGAWPGDRPQGHLRDSQGKLVWSWRSARSACCGPWPPGGPT